MRTTYLIVVLVFMALLLVLGFWVARRVRSGEDFLMAGRSLGPVLLLATTLATLVGTGSSLGAVGYAYENGWAGALYGIGATIGVVLLLLIFADARRHRFMTLPEEMSSYYGASPVMKGVVAVMLLIAEMGWLGAHVLGGSIYLVHLTDLSPAAAKILLALGFGVYTIVGGYLAVVLTDAVQALILFVGFAVLAVVALVSVGGLAGISREVPAELDSFLGLEAVGVLPAVSFALVIAVGVLTTPSYRQRVYSARSVSTVRRSFALVAVLTAIFAIFPAIAGISARAMAPGLEHTDTAFPYLATELFPMMLGALILVAGLSATMSSGDSDAMTAVTMLLRDGVQLVTGRQPRRERMVANSRISLAVVLLIALIFALLADTIIEYITMMISTILTGFLVASLLGKYWKRATVPGGFAAMIGGSGTALIVNNHAGMTEFWGNAVIPSLLVATVAGVLVSLVTRPPTVSREEAVARLEKEREVFDVDLHGAGGTE